MFLKANRQFLIYRKTRMRQRFDVRENFIVVKGARYFSALFFFCISNKSRCFKKA